MRVYDSAVFHFVRKVFLLHISQFLFFMASTILPNWSYTTFPWFKIAKIVIFKVKIEWGFWRIGIVFCFGGWKIENFKSPYFLSFISHHLRALLQLELHLFQNIIDSRSTLLGRCIFYKHIFILFIQYSSTNWGFGFGKGREFRRIGIGDQATCGRE